MAITRRSCGWLLVALVALCVLVASVPAHGQSTLIRIATAGAHGIYYPAGGAICRLVNAGRFDHGIRCVAETSPGSVSNLRGVRSGEYDFAIVQSDWHYHAYRGSDAFEEAGRDRELRSVFSLHAEAFTVVARREAEIRSFADLKGKRVNVGAPGSGNRATLNVVLEAVGMTEADFALASELPTDDQARALCDGSLDAVILLVGHPNRAVEEMTKACQAVLVPVAGAVIDQLVEEHPYYLPAEIPGGLYAGDVETVKTFGLAATMVTSFRTDPRIVYEVARAVFENLDAFREMHPALAGLDRDKMIHEALTAPLHSGVVRYLAEQDLK